MALGCGVPGSHVARSYVMRVRAFVRYRVPSNATYGILRARLQPATDLHGAWHAWTPTPSRARGSTRLSICTERGKCGRARARALSGDVQMHGCASWNLVIVWYGTTRGVRAFKTRRDKAKPHTPFGVCAFE